MNTETSFEVGQGAFNKAYEGDTVKLNLRLTQTDSSEIRGKSEAEKILAIKARDFAQRFIC